MPVSQLESLPNEILKDILEKYIDGVDIINAFAFQLNRRFDALIIQSRRLRFNFRRCHKDHFRLCLGLLSAYANKIEQLTLAEQFTPGQIHAFLSLYPSFGVFKHLRKLYLQADVNTVDPMLLENAVHSLSNTALHTLTITISASNSYSLQNTIREIFYNKTLKKLSINCYFPQGNWNCLKDISSNIQYLALQGTVCECADLQHIFRCAPDLRYFKIILGPYGFYTGETSNLFDTNSVTQMPMLHTAAFKLVRSDEKIRNQLKMYFECMPSLRHLEINIGDLSSDMDAWEALIQTSLSSLHSFFLEVSLLRITDKNVSDVLAITETSFWTKKERFNFIIKDLLGSRGRRFKTMATYELDADSQDSAIFRWDTKPKMSNYSTVLNRISKLYLFPESHSLTQDHYLNHLTHLFVDNLNDQLLTFIITHINCSRIQHLDISSTIGSDLIFPLVHSATNIRSLRLNLRQLYDELDGYQTIYPTVQSLDISSDQHSFSENVIFMIRRMFPNLEHLVIFTKHLQNVPMLETYFPRLRSLTFHSVEFNSLASYDSYEEKLFDRSLRERTKFFFERDENLVTVWIDQAALRNSYWKNSGNSTIQSLIKNPINKISSMFK